MVDRVVVVRVGHRHDRAVRRSLQGHESLRGLVRRDAERPQHGNKRLHMQVDHPLQVDHPREVVAVDVGVAKRAGVRGVVRVVVVAVRGVPDARVLRWRRSVVVHRHGCEKQKFEQTQKTVATTRKLVCQES